MRIRKQVYDLKLDDLARVPVWEFALDEECEEGQDEATVRPFGFSPPLDPTEGMFVVKTDFWLADGTNMIGYATPPMPGFGFDYMATVQPVIVHDAGQVMLWYGVMAISEEDKYRNYQMLNREPHQVFPLRFAAAIDLLGDPIQGTIKGFMHYHDESRGLFRRKERTIREVT